MEEIFEDLRSSNETIPIIVEGQKDEATLRKIGLTGKIIRLNTGLSILDLCENIAREFSEIILLPDWDTKGQQLYDKLVTNFKPTKMNVIDTFWRDFKRFCSKEIQEVEQLVKYL